MAPVVFPPLKKERFLLDESGTLLLTGEQARARVLNVSIEKVELNQRVEYYNFRYPEPQAFWGYTQWVDRDFVIETVQLEYRRHSLLDTQKTSPDEVEQLRCLVKESTLLLFDNLATLLLAAGGDAEAIGMDRANYLLATAQPRLIPFEQRTALWYKIMPGFGGYISLEWGDYPVLCGDLAGKQTSPTASSPGKGDGGPGGGGGGGTRPATPPPPERGADPDSDSPAPPPETPGGPPSPGPQAPPPPPGVYLVRFRVVQCGPAPAGGFAMITGNIATVRMQGPASPTTRPGGPGALLLGLQGPDGVFEQVASVSTAVVPGCVQAFVEIVSQAPR